jgi:hypothetical protein
MAADPNPDPAVSLTRGDDSPLGGFFTDPKSPLAPLHLQSFHVVAVAIIAAVFLIANFMPLWHTDTWSHLKFGQWIVQHRQLPDHEPFCDFADQSAPYVAFGWLSQVISYLVYDFGGQVVGGDELERMAAGVDMLRGLHALLLASKLALLYFAYRRLTDSPPLACAGIVCVIVLSLANFAVQRPQVLAEPLFALLLLALSRPLLTRQSMILLPLLMVLWANLHGSYPVGLITLFLCGAGSAISVLIGARSFEALLKDARTRRLFLTLLLALAAIALLNPHGPWLFGQTLDLTRHPNIADMDEWKPLEWGYLRTYLFLGSLLLIGVTVAGRLRAHRSPESDTVAAGVLSTQSSVPGTRPAALAWLRPEAILLLLFFGVQTYLHQRLMSWWAMVVPWVLLPLWRDLLGSWRSLIEDRSIPSLRKTILAVALVVMVVRFAGPVQVLFDRDPRPLERSLSPGTPWRIAAQLKGQGEYYPALSQWLAKQPAGRAPGRIFASETQGDYLLWTLPAEMPIAVYTHVHLFPVNRWRECQRVKFAHADWQAILDRQGCNLIIFESDYFPALRERILSARQAWEVLLDESGDPSKPDKRSRVMIAGRVGRLRLP